MRKHFTLFVLVVVGLICASRCRADDALTVACEKPDGVYNVGQTIRWNVRWTGPGAIASAEYSLKLGGRTEVEKGKLSFTNGDCTITATLDRPDTILAVITADSADGTHHRAVGGAVAAPDKIFPAAACPPDFDAFWDAKLRELHAIPPNPQLQTVDSEKPGVDYWKITMDNIRGIHIQGQIARPKNGEKFPALLIPQWAGVYPLDKTWVTDRAAEGWLALDISAHDIPSISPRRSTHHSSTAG